MDSDTLFIGGFIAGAALLIGLLVWAVNHDQKVCASHGGHILSKTTPGFGVGSNGRSVTTFNTVEFCISQDGRILY